MATSIAGNDGFSRVNAQSGYLSELNVAEGKIANLNVNSVTSSGNVTQTGAGHITTVYGYAPNEFATAAIASSYYLLKVPDQVAASALTDPQLLTIPGGAQILRATVDNNGTTIVGGTTFTIGTALSSASVNTAPTTAITTAMLLATANAIGVVGGQKAVAELAFGSAGQAYAVSSETALAVPTTTTDNYVSVTTNTTANTAGDLVVSITYINP